MHRYLVTTDETEHKVRAASYDFADGFATFYDGAHRRVYSVNCAGLHSIEQEDGHAEISLDDLGVVLAGLDEIEDKATTEDQGQSIRRLADALRGLYPADQGTVV
jgi:hypothetical protein